MIEYVEIPNLPNRDVKTLIVDCKISDKSVYALEDMGITLIPTVKIKSLYESVSTHPDMQIVHLGKNKFICEPTAIEYYSKKLNNAVLIEGNKHITEKYPEDIAYNCVIVGNKLIHSIKHTDEEIIKYTNINNLKTINVKQGYTKCSTIILDQNAIITSDVTVYKSAVNENIDSLFVDCGDVVLKGMSNGLIGGISGKISKDKLVVNGDLNKLHCKKTFLDFCYKYGIEVISLNDDIPVDIGSVLPISY